jgi:16S rRNA (guanine527-N7)-methyltransferase
VTKDRQGGVDLSQDRLDNDRADALRLVPVSRETTDRLDRFVVLLLEWQARINLIAPSTIREIWTRHIADSLQLLQVIPGAKIWVDFGSGGGFPAIPIACALAETPGAQIHLVESNGKKAAFLREVIRLLHLPAQVHQSRVENFGEAWSGPVDVVTARALAPLKALCDQAFPFISKGAIGLFLKGQDVDAELTEAAKYWTLETSTVPSKTSPEGSILVIRSLKPRI